MRMPAGTRPHRNSGTGAPSAACRPRHCRRRWSCRARSYRHPVVLLVTRRIADHRGGLGRSRRLCCRLDRHHADALVRNAGALVLRSPLMQGCPAGPRSSPAVCPRRLPLAWPLRSSLEMVSDGPVIEHDVTESRRPVTQDRVQSPIAVPLHHALHTGNGQTIGGQVIRAGDHLERHRVAHLPLYGTRPTSAVIAVEPISVALRGRCRPDRCCRSAGRCWRFARASLSTLPAV